MQVTNEDGTVVQRSSFKKKKRQRSRPQSKSKHSQTIEVKEKDIQTESINFGSKDDGRQSVTSKYKGNIADAILFTNQSIEPADLNNGNKRASRLEAGNKNNSFDMSSKRSVMSSLLRRGESLLKKGRNSSLPRRESSFESSHEDILKEADALLRKYGIRKEGVELEQPVKIDSLE